MWDYYTKDSFFREQYLYVDFISFHQLSLPLCKQNYNFAQILVKVMLFILSVKHDSSDVITVLHIMKCTESLLSVLNHVSDIFRGSTTLIPDIQYDASIKNISGSKNSSI